MKVHELLSDETKWCRGNLALDAEGNPRRPSDPLAIRWCMIGAFMKCYEDSAEIGMCDEIYDLVREKCNSPIAKFNDNLKTTFQQVKQLFLDLDI